MDGEIFDNQDIRAYILEVVKSSRESWSRKQAMKSLLGSVVFLDSIPKTTMSLAPFSRCGGCPRGI